MGRQLPVAIVAERRHLNDQAPRKATAALEAAGYAAAEADECYVDGRSLLSGLPPGDGSLAGLALVPTFDDRMVEKLWLFNGGHAAAAYLGWHAACATVAEALARPAIGAEVEAVVREAQQGFAAHLASRPGSTPVPPRSVESLLGRYAQAALQDPVTRVGREPRRKQAVGQARGPALAGVQWQTGDIRVPFASRILLALVAEVLALRLVRGSPAPRGTGGQAHSGLGDGSPGGDPLRGDASGGGAPRNDQLLSETTVVQNARRVVQSPPWRR